VRSFFSEVIEFATDVEEPLGKPSKFTTSVVIFELKAKHLQKATGGGDSIANGGRVGAKRGCSLREGELGNVEKMSGSPPLRNKTREIYLLVLRRLFQDLIDNGHSLQPGLIRREDFPPPDR
jgi:hypothetical protein